MITKEQVTEDLIKVRDKISKIPSVKEYRLHGNVSSKTVENKFGSWSKALEEVFNHYVTTIPCIKTVCTQCSEEFERKIKDFDPSNNYFCGSSCSAVYTNKNREYKRPKSFIGCISCDSGSVSVSSQRKHCVECVTLGRHKKGGKHITETTIGDYRSRRKDASVYSSIREHARKVNRTHHGGECLICQYSKHVDACHVKDIGDFEDSATVGDINHPSNVIPLCKNHHWEFDNDEMGETDLHTLEEYISRFE